MAQVTQLVVYPVKSCGSIILERAVVTPTGFRWDRHWVITDHSGKFITQRSMGQLALIEVALTPLELLTDDNPSLEGAELVLHAPGMPELRVPLERPAGEALQLVPVTVWFWSGEGADEGVAAAEWLTKYLGTPARLVRYAGRAGEGGPPTEDHTRRQVDQDWASPGVETAFADGFPFLLASEVSLSELNKHLPAPIPLDRFRPNILVGGAPLAPWEEDSWQQVELAPAGGSDSSGADSIKFDFIRPCSRCTVPTIDQATGVRSPNNEPTETLHKIRSGSVLGWTSPPPFKRSVFFAWNLSAQGTGAVAVGDGLRVVSKREGPVQPRVAA